MTYQRRLNQHLAQYKREVLGVAESGVFRYRGVDVEREHILPSNAYYLNVMEQARTGVDTFFRDNPRARHRYFHHLNSSQAFAFNLFFPFFGGDPDCADPLLRALGQEGALKEWRPEFVPVEAEQTNIDVTWVTPSGRTFCEVKLSESGFGKARDDDRHRAKIRDLYSEVLRGHVDESVLEVSVFLGSYQFLRNVWHSVRVEGSQLMFLLPREHSALWNQLNQLLERVAEPTRSRISGVAIEDLLATLAGDEDCPPHLVNHVGELRRKYIVGTSAKLSHGTA